MPKHQARKGLVPLKRHQRAWWPKNSYLGHLHKNQQLWFGQQLCVPLVGFQRLGDCSNQHNNWRKHLWANCYHLEERTSPFPKSSIWNVALHNSCWTVTTKKLFQKLLWFFLKNQTFFTAASNLYFLEIKYWLEIFNDNLTFFVCATSGWRIPKFFITVFLSWTLSTLWDLSAILSTVILPLVYLKNWNELFLT